MKWKKIAERNATGESWVIYELEFPWGATEIIFQWREPLFA